MYEVVVIYGGIKTEYEYKSYEEAMKHYAGWQYHSLDVYGQIKSNITIWHRGQCIMADSY